MADYAVLYHDPVRVPHDDSRTIFAAQSVWVCRDDRYAFEVHVLGQRGADDSDETLDQYGEGRYRFALALLGGQHAQSVALDDPPKADPIIVTVSATDVEGILASVPPIVSVTSGDVIYRFRTADATSGRLSRAAG